MGVSEAQVDSLKEYRCPSCAKGERERNVSTDTGPSSRREAKHEEPLYSEGSSSDSQDDDQSDKATTPPKKRKAPEDKTDGGGRKKLSLSYDEEADPARRTVIEGLAHVLSPYYEQEWPSKSEDALVGKEEPPLPWKDVTEVAQAIEREMFTQLAEMTAQMHGNALSRCGTAYKAKYRTLQFNLKDPKNRSLREAVFRESLPVARLVSMPPAEMANEEVAREIRTIRAQSLSRVVLEEEGTLELVRKTHRPAIGTSADDYVPPETVDLASSTDPYLDAKPTSTMDRRKDEAEEDEDEDVEGNHLRDSKIRDQMAATGDSPPTAGEGDLEWNDEWYGKIYIPDWEVKRLAAFAKFLGHSRRLSDWGSRELKALLPHNLHCSGRIDRERVGAYIGSLWSGSSSRDVIFFKVISPPALGGELVRLVAHLEEAERWAVVAHDPGRGIRDFYLAPLASEADQRLFPSEASLPPPGFDTLIGVIVVARDGTRGTAAVDDAYDPESKQ